ncbi:MAG: hypothetical protein RI964_618 [Pseudomonadota bacterium]|jgi:hypothetical protein
MKQRILMGAVLSSVLLAPVAQAEDFFINPYIKAHTPTSQFTFNADGTATDKKTGLMWQRCPVGTTYNDSSTPINYLDDKCNGENTALTWKGALDYAQNINKTGLNGYSDWRVPNLPELRSILELKNANPAINPTVFPGYTEAAFWTSTPSHYPLQKEGSGVTYYPSTAIYFADGDDIWPNRNDQLYVRLVRTAP